MNEQEIFNKAFIGLRNQGFKQSLSEPGLRFRCVYLSSHSGMRCAVGHVLSEVECVEYDRKRLHPSKFETINGVPVSTIDNIVGIHELLCDLQSIHDDANGPDDMRESLMRYALVQGLTVPE